jgi:cysteine desulfurase
MSADIWSGMELFLDANAHLPINPKALQAYCEFSQSSAAHGHPSSLSVAGRQAAAKLEECRAQIAQLIGAQKPEQIVFASTCTQAAEWGLYLLRSVQAPGRNTFENLLSSLAVSKLEHSSVKDATFQMFETATLPPKFLENDENGMIKLPTSQLDKAVCVHLQNELGTLQPIQELKSWCQYLFSDLSQSLGKVPINVQNLGVDFAIFSAHKFGGSGGVGILYLKDTNHWKPFGLGSRYFMDRPGTPDVAAIVATTVALQESLRTLSARTVKMLEFRDYLEIELDKREIEILGRTVARSPNTTFIYLPDQAARVLLELGQMGIHVGLGSACGSMHAGPSPIIKALDRVGTTQDYVRISQYGEYGLAEAKQFIAALDRVLY